jgi:CheY-like chemotaxis protein
MATTVVTFVDDIFFLAKIRETAKALGVTVVSPHPREGTVPPSGTKAIFLDLDAHTFAPLECILLLKSDPESSHIPIVAFASHVHTQLIHDARVSGCDLVLARSAFTQQLPDLLRRFDVA